MYLLVLDIFHQICLKYGIRYTITCGTLLGQVRHGEGWIPWDGDIDVLISDSDYKKFRQVRNELLPHGFGSVFVQRSAVCNTEVCFIYV